jgi:ABC-type sugar transport system substrate-binding protein
MTLSRLIRRRSMLPALLAVAVLAATGCGSGGGSGDSTAGGGSQGGGKARLGLVLPGFAGNPFINDIATAAKKAAADSGAELLLTGSNNAAEQVNAMDNYINAKVKVIGFDPIDAGAMGTAVQKANDANIPAISIVSLANAGKTATHVEADWHGAGIMVGKEIASGWCAKLAKCNVGIIQGSLADKVGISGDEGIREGLKSKPNVNIVAAAATNYDSTQALNAAQTMIQGHPELNFIVTWWSNGSLSALQAVQSANKTGKIGVASISGACADLQAVLKGEMFADVMMFPERMGKAFVDQALSIDGGKPVQDVTPTPLYLVTTDSAKALVDGKVKPPADVPEVLEHLKQAQAGKCGA